MHVKIKFYTTVYTLFYLLSLLVYGLHLQFQTEMVSTVHNLYGIVIIIYVRTGSKKKLSTSLSKTKQSCGLLHATVRMTIPFCWNLLGPLRPVG